MKKALLILAISPFFIFAQFTERSTLNVRSNAHESVVADINGDGENDVVYHNDSGVYWNESGEDADFKGIHQAYTIHPESFAEYIITIAAEDIDGDGDIDIAFGTQGDDGPGIAWIENIGGGEFSSPTTIIPDVDLRRIYFEDLDGDGDLDLIANIVNGGGPYTDRILVAENIGAVFEAPVIIDFFEFDERATNCGDIDGDGDLDIVIAIHEANEMLWYENMGGFTFGAGTLITTDIDYTSELHVVDMDADGDSDIVFSCYLANKIAWQENLGGGVFGDQHLIEALNSPSTFRLEDFDGDSDLDIVICWYVDEIIKNTLSIIECTGPGTFSESVSLELSVNNMLSISTGDVDMDGDIDVLHYGIVHGQYSFLSNMGGLSFGESLPILGRTLHLESIIIKDLDGDGLNDIIGQNTYYNPISWYKNLGDDGFSALISISEEFFYSSSFLVYDTDNDGDNDIVMASQPDSTIGWVENTGDGTFNPVSIIPATPAYNIELLSIDIDDDGDLDLLRSKYSEASNLSYFENIDGVFGPETEIPNSLEYFIQIKIYDIDNDGDEDIIGVGNDVSDHMYWFENTGGTFETEVELFAIYCEDFIITDVNGDGNPDIVALYGNEWDFEMSELFWYENLGGTLFDEKTVLLTGYLVGQQLESNDINGDGLEDLIIGGSSVPEFGEWPFDLDLEIAHIVWMENTGGGTFNIPIVINNNIRQLSSFAIGDIDNDGDVDLFSSAIQDSKLMWYENGFISEQQVQGNVYYDENENGIRDIDEVGLGGVQIESDPLGDFSYSFINGNYLLNFDDAPDGDYLVFPEALDHWTITSVPEEYLISVDDAYTGDTDKDFGLFPTDDETELTSAIIGSFPRCNSETNYWITYENIGGVLASGIVQLDLHEEITFVSSMVIPDSVVDNSIYWSFEDLFYFDEQLINLVVEMPGADFIDDTLTSYSTITALDDLGAELFVYEDSISQVLVCAYDPNDKTVSPKGEGDFGNIDPITPFLEYTVRFQNTGTDTALNIVIKDHLNENLDWSSLEILGNSHPMYAYVDHTGEASFTFNDIMLPDSNVNVLGSQGFVKYRIDLLPELPLGTVITNTARIYFDANPAVVTNTTINTLYEDDGSGIEDLSTKSVLVYPNPFTEITTVYLGESLSDDVTIRIFTVLGNEIYSNSNIVGNQVEISAADLGKGIYILTVEDNRTNQLVHSSKLIVQ